jgi:hypothetical protein
MSGKLQMQILKTEGNMDIDVSDLKDGVYILRANMVDKVQTIKLIK